MSGQEFKARSEVTAGSLQGRLKVHGEPQKLKTKLPDNPTIPFLSIYPKELKSGSHRGTRSPVSVVELVTKPRCETAQMPAGQWMG